MPRKNPNADIFWLIFLAAVLTIAFFAFIKPVKDRNKDCEKNSTQQTCIHHPGRP